MDTYSPLTSHGPSRRLMLATTLVASCLATMLCGSSATATATATLDAQAPHLAGINVHSLHPRHVLLEMEVKERRHLPRNMRVC